MDDSAQPDENVPSVDIDPAALKDAHGRTGRMLKNAGLPFESDEFDEDDDETSESSFDGAGSPASENA